MAEPAVVFDFDGVLVDSVEPLFYAYLGFLRDFGVEGTRAEFDRLNGPPLREIIAQLVTARGLSGTHADLMQRYRGHMTEAYARASLVPGMAELVRGLYRAGFELAVASSATAAQVNAVLDASGLAECFAFRLTAEDVERGKPDPEIYLTARARLGARSMLVVEDSEHGLHAARAAGLTALCFRPGASGSRCASSAGGQSTGGQSASPSAEVEVFTTSQELHAAISRALLACVIVASGAEVVFRPEGSWSVDAETERRVSACWDAARAERPQLFDAAVLCATEPPKLQSQGEAPIEITTCALPYRYVFAQRKLPELGLALTPLAVSGRTRDAAGRVLFGRRAAVTQYPGHWELVPSGGLEVHAGSRSPDAREQLLRELEQESGIPRTGVAGVHPLALVHDLRDGVLELCFALELSASVDLARLTPTAEYDAFHALSPRGSTRALGDDPLVPLSRLLSSLSAERA